MKNKKKWYSTISIQSALKAVGSEDDLETYEYTKMMTLENFVPDGEQF